MASSSQETVKNNGNGRNLVPEKALTVFKEQDVEDNWLELGLGLRISKVCKKNEGRGSKPKLVPADSLLSCDSLSLPIQNSQSLDLERCSGLGTDLSLRRAVGAVDRLHHYQHSLLRWPGHSPHYGYDNGMTLWPSSSLDMDSARCNSHNYSTTSPYHPPGLWFTLRSSTNRNGQALPQIPKVYIRVKNEDVTILTVKRYLVAKLGLSNEDEIDILCTGQSLPHLQTLKQVRDTVWLPRLAESVTSTSVSVEDLQATTTALLMLLYYQRQCISN